MAKAASNRDICFIKALLLLCEHGHFKEKSKMVFFNSLPLPNTFRVKIDSSRQCEINFLKYYLIRYHGETCESIGLISTA